MRFCIVERQCRIYARNIFLNKDFFVGKNYKKAKTSNVEKSYNSDHKAKSKQVKRCAKQNFYLAAVKTRGR
jgi:hypothetical protein